MTVKPCPFGRPRFSIAGGSDAVPDSAGTDVEAVGTDVEAVGTHTAEAVCTEVETHTAETVSTDVEAVDTHTAEAVGTDVETHTAETVGTDVETHTGEAVGTEVDADDVAPVTATRHPRANRSAIAASAAMLCWSSTVPRADMFLASATAASNACLYLSVSSSARGIRSGAMLTTESTAAAAGSWYARWTDV